MSAAPWLVFGFLDLTRFVAYTGPLSPAQTPTQLIYVDELIPLWVYSFVWALAGVLSISSVWCEKVRAPAIGLNVGLLSLWGFCFMLAFAKDDIPRAWITSTTYIAFALLVTWYGWRFGGLRRNKS